MTAPTSLDTARGRWTLAFVCAVGFLDFVGAAILNVALPSIKSDLGFTDQNLQWVISGYLVTYGGFMLLGGRAADLLGRRRVLVAGIVLFGVTSLVGGLAGSQGTLINARLVQGLAAAMMLPAALSILTTTFDQGADRHRALGAWGATVGLSAAVGVFLGGVLAEGPGWRWVLLINVPICAIVLVGAFLLVSGERPSTRVRNFDLPGAVLGTGGMLLLIYALVRAPEDGWGSAGTIGELAGAAALLALFVLNESRHPNPLAPPAVLRIKGLAAANGTQVIAMAGFNSMFFFITLYMQDVLGFSPIEAGCSYLPVAFGVVISSGIASQLFSRIGTRPVIAAGALLASGGVFWLSRIPVDGTYLSNLLFPLVIMSFGLGFVFVGVTTAANEGVPRDKAGLAAALINASTWVGGALGLAVFDAIATSHTNGLLAEGATAPDALTAGFRTALLACGISLVGAAVIALRATNIRGASSASGSEAAPTPIALPREADRGIS